MELISFIFFFDLNYMFGFIRYENDTYMSNPNPNPWAIATLWMAWYYLETGRNKEALDCFSYV